MRPEKVDATARREGYLMNRTPGNCKKVTLDWHADHDVYKKHQFDAISGGGDRIGQLRRNVSRQSCVFPKVNSGAKKGGVPTGT